MALPQLDTHAPTIPLRPALHVAIFRISVCFVSVLLFMVDDLPWSNMVRSQKSTRFLFHVVLLLARLLAHVKLETPSSLFLLVVTRRLFSIFYVDSATTQLTYVRKHVSMNDDSSTQLVKILETL